MNFMIETEQEEDGRWAASPDTVSAFCPAF